MTVKDPLLIVLVEVQEIALQIARCRKPTLAWALKEILRARCEQAKRVATIHGLDIASYPAAYVEDALVEFAEARANAIQAIAKARRADANAKARQMTQTIAAIVERQPAAIRPGSDYGLGIFS